jgi:hypothetical protein
LRKQNNPRFWFCISFNNNYFRAGISKVIFSFTV